VGHGERRDHPFHSEGDHPRSYRVDRQDYWFRYVLGLQLDLVGESLMGWMVRDLMRGVDLLETRREVDPARIVLIGSVAGGGDVAAVTAAIDSRIAGVVAFNFGRASPVNAGPTSECNFAGSGSWESTRNLRGSARDGFLPWSILAAVAPRRLIYAHEFDWSPDEDPVWARLVRVWELHGARDRLASVHGRGSVTGPPPHTPPCNNVGPIHRTRIEPLLGDWFGIPAPAPAERRSDSQLRCWTPSLKRALGPRAVHAIARDLASTRLAAARRDYESLGSADAVSALRMRLADILGPVEPSVPRSSVAEGETGRGGSRPEDVEITSEPGVRIGLRLRLPSRSASSRPRVVLGLAQDGARALLRNRRRVVRGLLDAGLAVCLVDVRGAGRSGHDDATRGRHSLATEIAASEAMLGHSLLGARLLDARSALAYLRGHTGLDTSRIAVWGDSLAPPNLPTDDVCVPFDAGASPTLSEPLGPTLALLLAVFEPDVRAVIACGGLISFASLLDGPFCHVPRDVVVPGMLAVADVADLLVALSGVPVRVEAPTDGRNRLLGESAVGGFRAAVFARREQEGGRSDLTVTSTRRPARELVDWIARELGRAPSRVP